MTPLRRRMTEDMQLRNLSPKTIRVYVERIAKFARHFGRSPERLGKTEVRSYLVHWLHSGCLAAGFRRFLAAETAWGVSSSSSRGSPAWELSWEESASVTSRCKSSSARG